MIGATLDNLKAAAAGEHFEQSALYPGFAKVAREEGFDEIAELWERVSVAERFHEKRYAALAANVEAGKVFKRAEKMVWRCRNCGYIHEGPGAPESCPACKHPKAYFELKAENW